MFDSLTDFITFLPSPSKEIQALGTRVCLCTADPRGADPACPQTEGNDKQEGVSGAPAGRLHRQPAGQGHGGDPQHPPGSLSGWQKSRKNVKHLPPALRLVCEFVSACSQGRGLGVPESPRVQAPDRSLPHALSGKSQSHPQKPG